MNCVSHQSDPSVGEHSRVAATLITSETVLITETTTTAPVNELALQAEMQRRAEMITDVLAGIMDRPAAFRHWGLNE